MIAFTAAPVMAEEVSYTVMQGDTLWDIAQQYHIEVATIQSLNGLTGDSLQIGQKLVIIPNDTQTAMAKSVAAETPTAEPAAPTIPAVYYTVKAGDTLWDIANLNGTTVDTIRSLNGLSGDALEIGQVLMLAAERAAGSEYEQASRGGDRTPTQGAAGVLDYAASYLGTPYAYGGSGPGGFDCSGFTSYVFKHFGINLSRSADAQYANGTPVTQAELQPGDLVFFRCNGGKIDHVGIFVSDRTFIHSSSPRSGGVIYTSLDESFYSRSYAGAVRVL